MRKRARLPPRRRVVHQDGGVAGQAPRGGHRGGEGAEPPLPDHGLRLRDAVDPRVRPSQGARLASEHARLDDLQEALFRPRAPHLGLPRLRLVRRDRQSRRAEEEGRRGMGRLRGSQPPQALHRCRENPVRDVREHGLPDPRRWEPLARCGDRRLFDPGLQD